ncbi:MAG: SDR family NAD(P)-dependent oxidoreductase [Dehalococcoidia bacterium]|nr:SDR family NAD(P)-dependent oxidoreductase [Dehalococcoidia bacterium]
MDYFAGKVAVVTGGASGIGRALCEALARMRAASIAVADTDAAKAAQVAAGINSSGGRASSVVADVTDAGQVQALVDRTLAEHGRLDFMFNNAGIAILGEVRDISLEQWERVIAVDLWGVINGTLASYRAMIEQGSGHIVNTASLCGLIPIPMVIPYSTAKHAVVGLSTSLRLEAARFGVRVSVICPGLVNTGIFDAAALAGVKWDRRVLGVSPVRPVNADRCAYHILRGVRKNRPVITVPPRLSLLWSIYRVYPPLANPLLRKALGDIRRLCSGT